MEKRKKMSSCSMRRVSVNSGGMEANTLAILDSADSHKDSQDAIDDRTDFLEAVRSASIVPENGTPPTEKMVEAVFETLRAGKSLELIMSSFGLLNEIEKRFPRVYISETSADGSREVVVIDEAWCPFSWDVMSSQREETHINSTELFDAQGFHELIQGLAKLANRAISDMKALGNMFLFQYLVNVLEGDFSPRFTVYKETTDWNLLRECLLNMLLGSRKVNYKALMKDCLSTICGLCQYHAGADDDSECSEASMEKSSENHDADVAFALPEVKKTTCMAMQKLLIMIMELDMSKKQADLQGQITRADGLRTPLAEIILDELTYDREMLSSFLQVFNDSKWKLEIIVHYLLKYTRKPSVRNRKSTDSSEDSTFNGVLKSFSNINNTRNIIKKLDEEIFQLLLAHGFQAYLSIWTDSKEDVTGNIIAAFNTIREADKNIEISSIGKEALFTAAMIISKTP